MNIAIIGCGAISDIHAAALIEQGLNIVALCDISVERAQRLKSRFSLNSQIFTDYRQLYDSVVLDAVHVCTPHYLHAEMAINALNRGIAVLLEKPACINENEIIALKEAATKAQLGICLQNRYLQSTLDAAAFLKDKRVRGILGTVFWARDKDYYALSDWRGKWETEGGGVLINQAIHTLDLMLLLGGMPQALTATVANRHLEGIIDVEDIAECFWETENGSALLFATTAATQNYPIDIKIDTDGHQIEITSENCIIDGEKAKTTAHKDKDYWGAGHHLLINDFYDCLKCGRKFPIGIDEGIKSLKIVLAAYKSNGKKVQV